MRRVGTTSPLFPNNHATKTTHLCEAEMLDNIIVRLKVFLRQNIEGGREGEKRRNQSIDENVISKQKKKKKKKKKKKTPSLWLSPFAAKERHVK